MSDQAAVIPGLTRNPGLPVLGIWIPVFTGMTPLEPVWRRLHQTEDREGNIFMMHETSAPVITGVSYFLGHIPGLIRYGSKPYRELKHEPSLLPSVISHLRTFDQAVA